MEAWRLDWRGGGSIRPEDSQGSTSGSSARPTGSTAISSESGRSESPETTKLDKGKGKEVVRRE
jgi:hypothetical protein